MNEILLLYWEHARRHYCHPDGSPTSEQKEIRLSLRPVRELYGQGRATGFGPKALAAVRDRMARAGLCRGVINRRVDRVKRCFRWAVAEELVPPEMYEALRALPGLQAGRTAARESNPVGPVLEADYDATLPYLPRCAPGDG